MVLIIGGSGHGKLGYVLEKTGDVQVAEDFAKAHESRIFNKLHIAVQKSLKSGTEPGVELEEVLSANPDIIIICDEVGGGVVPADPEGREWRETVGRLCHDIAKRAEYVERVFCGLPMRLKGEGEWK